MHFQLCGHVSFGAIVPRRKPPDTRWERRGRKSSSPLSFRFKSPLLRLCLPPLPGEQTAVAQPESSSRVLSLPPPTPTNPCCVRFSLRHLHSSSNVKAAFLSYQVFLGPMQSRRRQAPHFIPWMREKKRGRSVPEWELLIALQHRRPLPLIPSPNPEPLETSPGSVVHFLLLLFSILTWFKSLAGQILYVQFCFVDSFSWKKKQKSLILLDVTFPHSNSTLKALVCVAVAD